MFFSVFFALFRFLCCKHLSFFFFATLRKNNFLAWRKKGKGREHKGESGRGCKTRVTAGLCGQLLQQRAERLPVCGTRASACSITLPSILPCALPARHRHAPNRGLHFALALDRRRRLRRPSPARRRVHAGQKCGHMQANPVAPRAHRRGTHGH